MGLPTGLNGLDIPPKSRFVLPCPKCGRQFAIISLGRDGRKVSMRCPYCSVQLGVVQINKLIAVAKAKTKSTINTQLRNLKTK